MYTVLLHAHAHEQPHSTGAELYTCKRGEDFDMYLQNERHKSGSDYDMLCQPPLSQYTLDKNERSLSYAHGLP